MSALRLSRRQPAGPFGSDLASRLTGGVLAKTDSGRDRRRPSSRPPLAGLVTEIVYRTGEQSRTSVEKILPGPGTGLWVNLNRDAFRSFGWAGQVRQVPGAMVSGPTGRASVIEFEEGHAHVSVTFALGAAPCFFAPPLALLRDDLVPVEAVCGGSRASLREQLLEAPTPEDALVAMEDFLIGQMVDGACPDPAVIAAARALARGSPVGEVVRSARPAAPDPAAAVRGAGGSYPEAVRPGAAAAAGGPRARRTGPGGLGRHGRPAWLLRPGASGRRVPGPRRRDAGRVSPVPGERAEPSEVRCSLIGSRRSPGPRMSSGPRWRSLRNGRSRGVASAVCGVGESAARVVIDVAAAGVSFADLLQTRARTRCGGVALYAGRRCGPRPIRR